jgi:hypothetical protein
MKKIVAISILFMSLFLTSCGNTNPSATSVPSVPQNDNKNDQTVSFITQIDQSLAKGASIKEIDNPNLTLPLDINISQIKKYFQIDTILFALVLRNSMNVVLSLPTNFTPSFAGVLIAQQGDTQWTKFIEIKDRKETDKNNPYYLAVNNNKLLLTIVDQNGAGSGEGYMKVFALSEIGTWKLESCYYFGAHYNDPSTDGDYFAFSVNFAKQKPEAKASCNNIQFIAILSQSYSESEIKAKCKGQPYWCEQNMSDECVIYGICIN